MYLCILFLNDLINDLFFFHEKMFSKYLNTVLSWLNQSKLDLLTTNIIQLFLNLCIYF